MVAPVTRMTECARDGLADGGERWGVMTDDDERRAFVDVEAGIAETVRAIEALVERWPANDA